jgi:hypothetical protein
MQKHRRRALVAALLATALTALGLAGVAQAKLTGNFTRFAQCPYKNTEVRKCILSTTESGEVILGKKVVPITKAVVLQGGAGKQVEGIAPFFAAANGITLSKAPQNVPGGLLGIVPDASSPFLVKALIKFFLENSLTGVNSTLELAKPASEIRVSENNLAAEEGVALKMPVRVHLENPFLGKNCFVGSATSPITWNLTTGTTAPPGPNKAITGKAGFIEFLEEGSIAFTKENVLVDNAWSAPTASGCGGILSFLVTPIINAQLGTTTAGNNTAILKNTLYIGAAAAVKENDELNP